MPLQIIRQDITKMHIDAVVSTDTACVGLAEGSATITEAHGMTCRYIINTSAPVWQGGSEGEAAALRSCYLESLKLAVKNNCGSVALPLIGSGVYGYPKDGVLKLAVQTVTEFLLDSELTVYICVFDKNSYLFDQTLLSNIRDFINGSRTEDHAEVCFDCKPPEEAPKPAVFKTVRRMSANAMPTEQCGSAERSSLHEYLRNMDKSFSEMLFDLIDRSGMTDVECYKKANITKQVFHKIKTNKDYKPSKPTAIAFAIALRLSLDEAQALLATVGMTLSRSNTFDSIIRYFIQTGVYDVFEINEALFEFDQVLLGSF